MAIGDDNNKINHIEEAKRRLYSVNPKLVRRKIEGKLTQMSYGIPRDWKKAPSEKSAGPRSTSSLMKKFFIFSVIFFCIALAFVSFKFFSGTNTISNDNIDISVLGNSFVAGGEDLPLQIQIANNNSLPLQLSDLLIQYPNGASGETTGDYVNDRISLGSIAAGATVNSNAKVTLFGEQGSTKDINISLEYRVEGSNAIFVKEITHSVNISSAPVNLTVDAPTSVTAGQEVDLSIKISPNSSKLEQGMLLKVAYPPDFSFTSATPAAISGNDTFALGDLAPGVEKDIAVKGTLSGVDGEQKSFQFYVGEQDANNKTAIGVTYTSYLATVSITKPFINAHLVLNGLDQSNYSISGGNTAQAQINWVNNLPTKVENMVIMAHLDGNALDKSSVKTLSGFYDSSADDITWSKDTVSTFAEVQPGDQGTVDFSFASLPLLSGDGALLSSPNIVIDVSVSAEQPSSGGGEISNSESRTIKINSDLQILVKALYADGPLTNTGPMPPKAESKTTYTIVWTAANSANDVSGAVATATLPLYVNYVGNVSPPSENVSYDESSRKITWNLGTVAAGTGLASSATREVAFQVELNPSISQVGSVPQLLSETDLSGADTYTGAIISSSRQALNTKLSSDSQFKPGDEIVVQ